MVTPVVELTLEPLKCGPLPAAEALHDGVAALDLPAGQDAFVGVPAALLVTALADPSRHPFAIVAGGDIVGFCILHATRAAVERADLLAQEHKLPAKGVVLGVNERNVAGQVAYGRAGFTDTGQYLGGRSGSQRTMYKAFAVDETHPPNVNIC